MIDNTEKVETVADVVAEMREIADRVLKSDAPAREPVAALFHHFAWRVEDAAKREKEAARRRRNCDRFETAEDAWRAYWQSDAGSFSEWLYEDAQQDAQQG